MDAPVYGPERDFLTVLGYFYLQHDRPEKAGVLFAALDALCPDCPDTLKLLAHAHIRSGKAEAALTILDRLARAGEDGTALHLMRAQALTALGRESEAREIVRRHLSTPPSPGTP